MTDDPHHPTPGPKTWLRKHPRVIATAVTAMALLAAAGAYAIFRDDSGNASGETEAGLEFAECVRGQGIDDFPDPTFPADGGIRFYGVDELGVSDEDLQAARDACHHIIDEILPDEEPGSPDRSADEPAAAGWDEITPGGDCQCADGSDYRFYAREANPEKVVLFLDGGGGCWSAETCAPDGTNEYQYQRTTDVPNGEGVFDADDQRNPFADHSFVYMPYCTGDVHLGNATAEYTSDLTVHHKGYANGTAALDYLAETFPDAIEIAVIGISAGSASAPLYAALVSDRFPAAEITSIGDSSGAFPDKPEFNDLLTGNASWGATEAMSLVPSDLQSIPGLYISAAQRHPDMLFARYDRAYDEVQQWFVDALTGRPGDDLLTMISANEAQIENAGVNLLSYTAPGDRHLALDDDAFYSESVGGVDLSDWVTAVINDEPVEDVRCTDCTS